MRLMTWNIKTGGYDRGGADRLDAIIDVIRAENPDLLALQELRDVHRGRGQRLTDALGMTPVIARSYLGQPVAVFSRLPVRRRWTARFALHHAAAAATVDGPFTLVSAHLNPFSPGRRVREARWLMYRLRRLPGPLVLAGDLNALDPWTDHTARLAALPGLYRRRHVHRDGTPHTDTIAALAGAGLTDLWRQAGTGDGRTAPTSEGGGREFSDMRLDYLLATAGVTARAVRVVRGGATETASDHYPVVADL
jgi:exodeoxyribonuclease-3